MHMALFSWRAVCTSTPASRRALARRKLPLPSTPNEVRTPPWYSARVMACATFMAASLLIPSRKHVAPTAQVVPAPVPALGRLVLGRHARAAARIAAQDRRLPRLQAEAQRESARVLAGVALRLGLVADAGDVLGLVGQGDDGQRDVSE